jgi:hypothetical protein
MRELRPLITSSLAVALILPALLGLAPGAQANPAEELLQLSELQLCAQLGHLPDDDARAPKGQHSHDCPCCLPGAAATVATPLLAAVDELVPFAPRLFALVPAEWVTPAQLPHDRKLALQTGPPAFGKF